MQFRMEGIIYYLILIKYIYIYIYIYILLILWIPYSSLSTTGHKNNNYCIFVGPINRDKSPTRYYLRTIASCTPIFAFCAIRICEWKFIALLMNTKEVRIFRKMFFWKILSYGSVKSLMENIFHKRVLYYGKYFP